MPVPPLPFELTRSIIEERVRSRESRLCGAMDRLECELAVPCTPLVSSDLCLVSKTWNASATPLLYTEVSLEICDRDRFLRTIYLRPELSCHVQRLETTFRTARDPLADLDWPSLKHAVINIHGSGTSSLYQLLAHAPSLQHLMLDHIFQDNNQPPAILLPADSIPVLCKLQSLSLPCPSSSITSAVLSALNNLPLEHGPLPLVALTLQRNADSDDELVTETTLDQLAAFLSRHGRQLRNLSLPVPGPPDLADLCPDLVTASAASLPPSFFSSGHARLSVIVIPNLGDFRTASEAAGSVDAEVLDRVQFPKLWAFQFIGLVFQEQSMSAEDRAAMSHNAPTCLDSGIRFLDGHGVGWEKFMDNEEEEES